MVNKVRMDELDSAIDLVEHIDRNNVHINNAIKIGSHIDTDNNVWYFKDRGSCMIGKMIDNKEFEIQYVIDETRLDKITTIMHEDSSIEPFILVE